LLDDDSFRLPAAAEIASDDTENDDHDNDHNNDDEECSDPRRKGLQSSVNGSTEIIAFSVCFVVRHACCRLFRCARNVNHLRFDIKLELAHVQHAEN